MKKKSILLLENLLKDAEALKYQDGNLDKVRKRAEMIAKKVFGKKVNMLKN